MVSRISRGLLPAALLALWLGAPRETPAFCGFYVGKADAALFNEASQVAIARRAERTVVSMMNDYAGPLAEFALVVPVPVLLEKGQVHVGDSELFHKLDAFTAPRLVEYTDPDPCAPPVAYFRDKAVPMAAAPRMEVRGATSLGVRVEARYTVGEYDVAILSATESDGLETWLVENGYRIPRGASAVLRPYVRQGMKFFVARVNLAEHAKSGTKTLRPLQFAYASPRFMLPVRLGMMNARGPQDLVLYVLTEGGRVETTNYRTMKLPTGMDVPEYVKDDFGGFYKALFAEQVRRAKSAVFTEHYWNMGWCDPCAGDPLTPDELRRLGVFWLDDATRAGVRVWGGLAPAAGPLPVTVTRLHVRTTAETFPEDLVFQETKDRQSFQGRYVLRHPWHGDPASCPAAPRYFDELRRRREREAETLAELTGWALADVRGRMDLVDEPARWWERLWR